jgi:acylphosphatase
MKIIYSGYVQGVGFRYYIYRNAMQYQIFGSVKNLLNGKVELIINDNCENIEEFLESIDRGNGFINILKSEKSKFICFDLDFTIK